MISLSHIEKFYSGKRALHNVSFTVEKGEVAGLLGPNGAGKTTLMRILSGSLAPTTGTVTLLGSSFAHHPSALKKHIGYMPENNPLYGDMKVKEYLFYRGQIKGVHRKKIKQRYEYVAEQCDLTHVSNQLIGTLSRGFKQRIGLADTMIHDPDILILDEPTVGLDPAQIYQFRELIKSVAATKTIILSSHILPEVEMTCERVIIIKNGRILAQTAVQYLQRGKTLSLEIKSNTSQLESQFDAAQFDWRIDERFAEHHKRYLISHSLQNDIREKVFNFIVANKSILLEMRIIESCLEDIFMDIVLNDTQHGENTT